MRHIIENEHLKVEIDSLGAEVKSVVRKSDNKQLWWEGDEKYWNGSSPILFPACGGLWNGQYEWKGATYQMPKHGFVKAMEWECLGETTFKEEDEEAVMMLFEVRETEETLKAYPFHFSLQLRYILRGTSLTCVYTVANLEEDSVMPYQIGGHPAIALPDFQEGREVIGYISPLFNGTPVDAHCLSVVRAGEQGCWSKERHAVNCNEEGLIPVSVATFANEALIFDHNQINGADILNVEGEMLCRVESYSPVWLFWQMQDMLCPYVCAEPWYGLCDLQGESVNLIERPYTQCCAPQSEATMPLWSATF